MPATSSAPATAKSTSAAPNRATTALEEKITSLNSTTTAIAGMRYDAKIRSSGRWTPGIAVRN
jgi:hypothetical protein